jgi:hypothetical protein
MLKEFIAEYGTSIIYTIATAILGFIGMTVKNIIEKYVDEKKKEKVVETCVKAAEQIYKELKGNDKLEKVKDNIISMLTEQGLTISELEMDMMIEAAVAEMNKQIKKEGAENG